MAEKEKFTEHSLSLITTEGKEIMVSYELSEDEDDYIIEEIREALRNNEIYCGGDWANFDMKFGSERISELDMKKIIGIVW